MAQTFSTNIPFTYWILIAKEEKKRRKKNIRPSEQMYNYKQCYIPLLPTPAPPRTTILIASPIIYTGDKDKNLIPQTKLFH